MIIKELILENFRNFQNKTSITFDNLTVIVGKNDVGKSTILEALDIFINDGRGTVKLDKDDACKRSGSDEFSLSVIFSDFPSSINIDEGNMTSFQEEYLLNKDNFLEIKKTYKNGKNTNIFIHAKHPTSEKTKELLSKKQKELKELVEKYNYFCENKTKNASLRKAIREGENELKIEEVDIPVNEEDAKRIWVKLQTYLPVFALFQSDRPNKSEDSEIQDPMKTAIKEILQDPELQKKLIEIADIVKNTSKEIAEETLKRLGEIDEEIAKELNPKIPDSRDLNWETVFKNIEITSDNGVPLNKRGSGVRRLVLLSFFRAMAEKEEIDEVKSNVVYAIEEPETSQHPTHQKILIKALKDLSNKRGRQIFLTSHSPALVQLLADKSIRLLKKQNNILQVVAGDLAMTDIIDDLGVLPMISKVAIFVEGETDRDFLLGLNNIDELKKIIDISKLSIIPLNGQVLERWIKRNYLGGSNIIEFHLYDRDTDSKYKKSIEVVNKRLDNSKGILTLKREMENYINPNLLESFEKFKGINCDSIKTNWSDEDIPKFISDKVELNESEVKNIICGSLSRKMDKDLLTNIGAWNEVEGWFKTIKEMLNKTN